MFKKLTYVLGILILSSLLFGCNKKADIPIKSEKLDTSVKEEYKLVVGEESVLDVVKEKSYADILSKFPKSLKGFETVYLASFDDRYLIFSTETIRQNINVGYANNIHGVVVYDLLEDRVVLFKELSDMQGVVSDALFIDDTLYFSFVSDSNKKSTYSIYSIQEDKLNLILTGETKIHFAAAKLDLFYDGESVFTVVQIKENDVYTSALIRLDAKAYDIVYTFETGTSAWFLQRIGGTFYLETLENEKPYIYVFENEKVTHKVLMPKRGSATIFGNIILQTYSGDPEHPEYGFMAYDMDGNILLDEKIYKRVYFPSSNGENQAYYVDADWSLWSITLQDKTFTISKIKTNENGDPIRFHNKGETMLFLFDGKEQEIKIVA